ncbi:MAG: TolC family protein [Acetobacteraceae bacterium]|nr:TolC family protein [Acetobacteraceae bacterium]
MRSNTKTTGSGRCARRRWPVRALAAALLLFIVAAAHAEDARLGATVDGLLAEATRLSPEIAARALDTAAAEAGARAAGWLPDPTLRVTQDEIDVLGGTRRPKQIYAIEQEFPLWGKRELKAAADRARADVARAEGRMAEAELAEQVKVVFAQYWVAHRAGAVLQELHTIERGIIETARNRYAQGRGTQTDVLRASAVLTRHQTGIARFSAQKRSAQGVLNVLLLRDPAAPLADPRQLRPLPPATALAPAALIARADNPRIAAAKSRIVAAGANRELARKEWFPDVTLSIGAIDRKGYGPNGYMGAVSLRVPLQWGLRDARESQTQAELGAAEARRDASAQDVARTLVEAAAALAGARETVILTRDQLLPQLDAAVRSAGAAYGNGRTELTPVLDAVRELGEAKLSLLAAQLDEQRQLAAIERLIGGTL